MSLRINLEIGHEASLRTKRTPEGFTHDWKIFVRGEENADIQYYVEKVVFYLHETFQKPKRVVKEPPYTVKESGYAGFNLPIDIYLRNSGEPKKIKFNYDLHLQHSGPSITKVQQEKYVFNSVPEDFKQKVLRGGGVVTSGSQEPSESKSVLYEEKNQLISKPKFSGSDAHLKKPKVEQHTLNSFQDLFGTPITKTSKMPEPKAPPPPKESKNSAKPEKEKSAEKVKSKHSPHKEKEKDRERDKSEKKAKEDKKKDKDKKEKDRERNKEKSHKKERSPKPRSPSPKHPSPKPSSPLPPPPSQSVPAGKHRDKDSKGEKEKKEKAEKEEKKNKKEKKEKEHNKDKEKHRDSGRSDHKSKETKTKDTISALKESEVHATASSVPAPPPPQVKQEKKEKQKDEDKVKVDKTDKSEDKKHKHKKKDKNRRDRKEKEDKSHKPPKKMEKEKNITPPFSGAPANSVNDNETEKNRLFEISPKVEPTSDTSSPKEEKPSKPLNKLFSTYSEATSDSSRSSREPSPVPGTKKQEKVKKTDKKSNEKENEKRKKRKSSSEQEQPPEKVVKDEESPHNSSDIEANISTAKAESVDETSAEDEEDEEYMNTLRSLQNRIMAIKDNAELQRVVQMIAGTGQYEISANTFDFDLCLLDRSIVTQLVDFLSTNS